VDDAGAIASFALWYGAFLFSLTCHEAAHAFVAWRGGDDTAYRSGQVTLNPIPHVMREPVGTVLLPLFSFVFAGGMIGWASAPYDPRWEDRHPRRAALMSAAGPATNLLLAAVAFAVLYAGLSSGAWTVPPVQGLDRLVEAREQAAAWVHWVGHLASVFLSLNVLLALLNALPCPPLDGAAVLAGLVPALRHPYRALRGSTIAPLAGLVVAVLAVRTLYYPLLQLVLGWLHG
jgi:Zn-dependent protease